MADYKYAILGFCIGIIINRVIIRPIERRRIRNEIMRKKENDNG